MLDLTSVHHYFLRSFPKGKKTFFVILEGIAVVGLMKSDVFILSLEKVWHCLQQPIWTYDSKDLYSRDQKEFFPHKNL